MKKHITQLYYKPTPVFLFAGILFIIIAIFNFIYLSNFEKNAQEIEAKVSKVVVREPKRDGAKNYNIYITYTVDRQIYYNHYSSKLNVDIGSKVKIYYNKNNPNNIEKEIDFKSCIFLFAFGIIYLGIDIIIYFNRLNKIKIKKELLENGKKIIVNFREVNRSRRRGSGLHYFIICVGKDFNGDFRYFKSEAILIDPKPIIDERNITTFYVYIDENNPKKYYLSLENIEDFLLEN